MAPAEAAAPAAPAAPAADETRIETPGLADSTQVLSPPPAPAEPWAPAPSSPPAPAWQPPAATPAPPASDPNAWQAPPAPAAPDPNAWQTPAAPAPGAPPTWGQQPSTPPGSWGATAPAPAPAGSGAAEPSPLGGLAAVAGGVLALVGVFSGWVTIRKNDSGLPSDGTLSMFSFASGDEVVKSNDPYLILALAIVGILAGVLLFLGKNRPIARIAAVVVGVGIIATAALNWNSIASLVGDDAAFQAAAGGTGATAKTAIGFYLAIAGGIVTAAGAVLPAKKA